MSPPIIFLYESSRFLLVFNIHFTVLILQKFLFKTYLNLNQNNFYSGLKAYKYVLNKNNMENTTPKLLILGHARHGKDTFAELLGEEFGLQFKSSSQAAADIFLYNKLKDQYGYTTSEECFEDRVNHRQEWYESICDYNKDDRARLAKDILKRTDCYVGMRDRDEIDECISQGLFDLIIWVDASDRLPLEPGTSFNIDKTCADVVIENNGTYEEFVEKVMRLGGILIGDTIDKTSGCGDEFSFLEFFSKYAVIDDNYQLEIDMFFDRVNITGWPETATDYADDLYSPVGIGRWDIHSLDSESMVLTCGSYSQIPLTLTLKVNDYGVYVDSYETCENWVRGLSGYEIKKLIEHPCLVK